MKVTKAQLKRIIKEELALATLPIGKLEEEGAGYIGSDMPPQQAMDHLNKLFFNGKISVNDLADHFGRAMADPWAQKRAAKRELPK
jgi:hypothetical protein